MEPKFECRLFNAWKAIISGAWIDQTVPQNFHRVPDSGSLTTSHVVFERSCRKLIQNTCVLAISKLEEFLVRDDEVFSTLLNSN